SLNTVILDSSFGIIYERYTRIKGQPLQKVLEELKDIFIKYDTFEGIAFTGTGGKLAASLLNVNFVNEIIAHAKGTSHFHPEVQTILDIGGEDSKIIEISGNGEGKLTIKDFSMNTLCAAGTGSFLDQQASRLGVSVENEFGVMSSMSKNPPRIAGRCSVFAKSDMIHLQQEATPDYDIVAGLCFAMIRNLKGTQGKGRALNKPFSLQGGVAANSGIVRAVKEIFELSDYELIIPTHFASMGAIGAAIHSFEGKRISPVNSEIVEILRNGFESHKNKPSNVLEPLKIIRSERRKSVFARKDELLDGIIDIHVGVDIGSISTNVAIIDDRGLLLSKSYLMTAGKPIEAVKKGLKDVSNELSSLGINYRIKSAGTTGSGRYLIGEIIGADIVKNEITAQARAAAEIDPDVDTIFEIGGQDSKYVSLQKGVVVDFEMNKVCAAGTGSFLEEQAEKLNISIKEEFGNLALTCKNPSKLGERCTVFMESDIVAHQQKGAKTEDLTGGLSYSIVYNYLNRVVGDKKVGNNIFFQGGVAFNDGVLAAFENVTGKKITVPPHHEVTGAIGIALIARDEVKKEKSSFVGFDLDKKNISIETFECKDCSNLCEVKKVIVERNEPLYFGSRCEKFELREKERISKIPDLFKVRERLLMKYYRENPPKNSEIKIGIPRALTFYDLFPMYSAFFIELGCEIVLSDKTNKSIIHAGSEHVNAEVCLPIKVAHGHVQALISKGVDYLFLPSVINMEGYNESFSNNFNCPYVQTIPYLVRAAMDPKDKKIEILAPVLMFQDGIGKIISSMVKIGTELGFSRIKVKAAIKKALDIQNEFKDAIRSKREKVEELLESYKPCVVIVSRSYNGFDLGINLNLPRKFKDLGVFPIPLDFLPLDEIKLPDAWNNMYWQYGQKFLKACEYIKGKPDMYAVYVTNFACGPDSFLI
ncbi:CoA activase, partial [bacterium]|nr:CoA activase [bacterium]